MIDDLQELRIGPIRLDIPVVLAPLAGYSDVPFRAAYRREGCRLAFTPLGLWKGARRGPRHVS